MRKISEAVHLIISNSDVASESLRLGILNLSAYAQLILPQVEELTAKPVQTSSIVASLSRLTPQLKQAAPLKPKLKLDEITLQTGLSDITFEKTAQTLKELKSFTQRQSVNDQHFLAVTQGVTEITLIASNEYLMAILEAFTSQPKQHLPALVGMSIRFSPEYLSEPNVIYTILSLLAVQRINLLEIVSTYTELTVILKQEDMYSALEALKPYLIT